MLGKMFYVEMCHIYKRENNHDLEWHTSQFSYFPLTISKDQVKNFILKN